MSKRILSACWDAGPANNVGIVVKALRGMNIPIDLFAGGPAKAVLQGMDVQYLPYVDAKDTIATCPDATLFYSGVDCNDRMPGAEIAHELMSQGKDLPILLQSDFWGAGIYRNEEWRNIKPTYFFGNDPRDAEIATVAFPLMNPKNALVVGWPWLDAYADQIQIGDNATRLRQQLQIPNGMPIVFFAGQLNRTGEVFASLVKAIIELDKPVCLLGRIHPRMLPENDAEGKWQNEYTAYQTSVEAFQAWGKGKYLLCNNPYKVEELIALADVVTGAFTTVLLESCVLRKPTIAILYPKVGMAEWLSVTGGKVMPEFPLTEIGCAAKADWDEKLKVLLKQAYTGELGKILEPNQIQHFKSDGGNAQRVADQINALL